MLLITLIVLKLQQKNQRANIPLFQKCRVEVNNEYQMKWEQECQKLGKERNCQLPSAIADDLTQQYRNSVKQCFKKYGIPIK